MSSVLEKPVTQESRRYAPTVRSVVAVAAALLAVFCLLNGLSYPGFPAETAVVGVLAAGTAAILVLASATRAVVNGRSRVRATAVLALVALILTGGVVAAQRDDGSRLQARWAASQAAFEQEVASAGDPPLVDSPTDSGYHAPYPGPCPATIGEFGIIECRSTGGAFLFLQSQGALTDDSGILFMPDRARSDWDNQTLIPLGGPWWSWTCYC